MNKQQIKIIEALTASRDSLVEANENLDVAIEALETLATELGIKIHKHYGQGAAA